MAIQGIFTDLYRTKLADLAADDLVGAAADMLLVNFAVGEGGFDEIPPASGNRFPKIPDGTETDLEAGDKAASVCPTAPEPPGCSRWIWPPPVFRTGTPRAAMPTSTD